MMRGHGRRVHRPGWRPLPGVSSPASHFGLDLNTCQVVTVIGIPLEMQKGWSPKAPPQLARCSTRGCPYRQVLCAAVGTGADEGLGLWGGAERERAAAWRMGEPQRSFISGLYGEWGGSTPQTC